MINNNRYNLIIEQFKNFFLEREYFLHPESKLINYNDPSLLFTNAGMNQFKDIFMGNKKSCHDDVISIQSCLRVGGKNCDIDNVGYTTRHSTFFQMMGSFSFGPFNPEQSIKNTITLLQQYNIDINRLWITVYHTDDNAFNIWKNYINEKRIIKVNTNDNFWNMGEEGPCGPCTEILYDMEYDNNNISISHKDVLNDSDRFLELWNIVFITYNKIGNNLIPLDKPFIDTGMGLERLLLILEKKNNIFETSIFSPLILKLSQLFNPTNVVNQEKINITYRICADHGRFIYFLMGEGLIPSNNSHGYILKKIIKRMVKSYFPYTKKPLGNNLIDYFHNFYNKSCDVIKIKKLLLTEEQKFIDFFSNQNAIINKSTKMNHLDGESIFFLQDTHGIAIDDMIDYCKLQNISYDIENYKKIKNSMNKKQKFEIIETEISNKFISYDTYIHKCSILSIFSIVDQSNKPMTIIIPKESIFFPKSGGQVGDIGHINITSLNQNSIIKIPVLETRYFLNTNNDKIIGLVVESCPHINSISMADVEFIVDYHYRNDVARNHSATHLLGYVLNNHFSHIKQLGSSVQKDKFSLDINFNRSFNNGEIELINRYMNDLISHQIDCDIKIMDKDDAINNGFKCLENVSYESTVRTINFGNKSMEFCCGTHVNNTSNILGFCIIKQSSKQENIRRIECITGRNFLKMNLNNLMIINDIEKYYNTNFQAWNYKKLNVAKDICKKNIALIKDTNIKLLIENNNIEKMYDVFMGIVDGQINMDFYDQYKHKILNNNSLNNIIIMIFDKNVIIIGGELWKDIVDYFNRSDLLIVGGGRKNLFRGKINNNLNILDNYYLIEKIINRNK